jgi:hypothetical protein
MRRISGISKDTIKVISGSTYAHTADTPEGEGLVSKNPGVKQLLLQIASKGGSKQRYTITTAAGEEKESGNIVNGDRLVVTSQNGKSSAAYTLAIQSMELCGKLELERDEITIPDIEFELTMYF